MQVTAHNFPGACAAYHCHQGSSEKMQVTVHNFPGACAAHHCQVSRHTIWGQVPQESIWCTSESCNFLPASATESIPCTSQLWWQYPFLSPAWVSKWALISCCFLPLLSGWETDVWRWPNHKDRAKIKAEPQWWCYQRRGRENFPCSHRNSRLNPHNQLGKHCICRKSEYTTCSHNWGCGLWGLWTVWTLEESTHRNKARSEKELAIQCHSRSRDLPRSIGGLPW